MIHRLHSRHYHFSENTSAGVSRAQRTHTRAVASSYAAVPVCGVAYVRTHSLIYMGRLIRNNLCWPYSQFRGKHKVKFKGQVCE